MKIATQTLRLAKIGEPEKAASEVAGWSYRPFEAGEPERSMWVAIERGEERLGWFWVEWVSDKRDAQLHCCLAPTARRRVAAKRLNEGFAWIAELMGAERLWVVTELEDVRGYMRRLAGWQETEEGMFMLKTRRAV